MSLIALTLLVGTFSEAKPVQPSITLGTSALLANVNVVGLYFTPDSSAIGIQDDATLKTWSLKTAQFTSQSEVGKPLLAAQRVHYSADGRYAASFKTEGNGKAQIIRSETGASEWLIRELPRNPDTVLFSESCELAAWESAGTVRVLRMENDEELAVLTSLAHLRRFSASRDGRRFVLCTRDGVVVVYRDNGPVWSPSLESGLVFSAASISPDGQLLATAAYQENPSGKKLPTPILIWSIADQKVLSICDAVEWFAEFPNRLRFSPDGKTLLAGDGAYIRGWNARTGRQTFAVEPGWNYPGTPIVSPDSRYVAVAYSQRAMVWDLETGRHPPGFEGHSGPVWELQFSRDGRRVATTSYGLSQVMVWNPSTGQLLNDLKVPYAAGERHALSREHSQHAADDSRTAGSTLIPGRIRVAFSADGTSLATFNEATGRLGPLRLWNLNTGRIIHESNYYRAIPPTFSFCTNRLVMAPTPNDPREQPQAKSDDQWVLPIEDVLRSMVVSQRGDRIACETLAQKDNPIRDSDGQIVDRFDGIPHAFSPNGQSLTIIRLGPTMTNGMFNDVIVKRDLVTKKETIIGTAPMGASLGRLSPDGELRVHILSDRQYFECREIAGDRKISAPRRIDDESRPDGLLSVPSEHRLTSSKGVFSGDGRLFAAVYDQGTLGVWEVATGLVVLKTRLPCQSPKFVAFSPDTRTVFTSSGEGAGGPVYGFDTAPPVPKPSANDLAGPPLSARGAVYALAQSANALTIAQAILDPASDADLARYQRAIACLDSESFRERESATQELSSAGWRAEPLLRQTLATSTSAEARERLTNLLSRPDARPVRAVHLLEITGGEAARAILRKIAGTRPESFVSREARRALDRLSP